MLEVSMNTLAYFVGAILPYLVVPVFVAGMAYRFRIWFNTPQPAKMTLFPAADSTFRGVLSETLFFPSLFRGDRVLWWFAWLFHITLALVFLGHTRVFTGLIDGALRSAGMSAKGIDLMSHYSGGAAGVLLLATGLLLLLRRLSVARVREISAIPDFLAPLLLVCIITTGDLMRFAGSFDLQETRTWAASLFTFSPLVPQNGMFLLHLLLAQLLIVFIPFSKILHFGGFFFTQAIIKRS
jgi:nitrate reductase gamma subunit